MNTAILPRRLFALSALVVALLAQAARADLVTCRLAIGENGPGKVQAGKDDTAVVVFDLSALPKGAKIVRSDLRFNRSGAITGKMDEARQEVVIHPLLEPLRQGNDGPQTDSKPLAIRGPWFDCLDATEAVAAWAGGKTNGGFFFKSCPLWDQKSTRLDVWYEGQPTDAAKAVPPARNVEAIHRAGQTFITFGEIEDVVGKDEIKWGELKPILDGLDDKRQVRYAVYRSSQAITPANLPSGELVALVKPASGWNLNGRSVDRGIDTFIATQYALIHGHWNPFQPATMDGKFGVDCPMDRLVIPGTTGETPVQPRPLPRGTGLYVHTVAAATKAWYAVVTCIEGVQNTALGAGTIVGPIDEQAGEGEPMLQREMAALPYFNYAEKRLQYVQWVAPPLVNLPSEYYNFMLAAPTAPKPPTTQPSDARADRPAPLELSLHKDDRSYWRTQYRIERDSYVLMPHDFPVKSWWYGYHESLGTLKSFSQGVVQPYTERRVMKLVEWACAKYPIDRQRVIVTGVGRSGGNGAGGSGALHIGLRYPRVFSMVLAGHGIADYAGQINDSARAKKPATGLANELSAIWGRPDWQLKCDTGRGVWDELNLARQVKELPAGADLPLVTNSYGGVLDSQRDFYVAMLDAGQPVWASFGVYGGPRIMPVSQTQTWPGMVRLEVRRDLSMPAFSGGDSQFLREDPKEASGNLVVSDGVKRWYGEFNVGYRWRTEDIIDQPAHYEIGLWWQPRGRMQTVTCDVTLRRLQAFKMRPDWKYNWELKDEAGQSIQKGRISVVRGAMRIEGVKLSATPARLIMTP